MEGEKSTSQQSGVKQCRKCGEIKPLTEFSKHKGFKDGLQYECKACVNAYNREYYLANSETIKKNVAEWAEANPGRARRQSQAAKEANTRRVDEWRERNPERFREQSRNAAERRRAAKLNAENPLTTTEWIEIVEEHGAVCFWCSAPWEVMDHVMPLALGGQHTRDNVVPACVPCNSRKAAKHPVQFWLEINGLV